MRQTLWWVLTLALMLGGLIGTVIPLIPGALVILLAAVMHHLVLGSAKSVGYLTLVGLAVLMILAQALEFISGSVGAKWYGATRWGAIGGILGGLVGIFLGLPGLFLGPVAGVLLFELLGGKGLLPATRSTWGTLLGTTAGILAQFVIGLLMIAWFVIAALM